MIIGLRVLSFTLLLELVASFNFDLNSLKKLINKVESAVCKGMHGPCIMDDCDTGYVCLNGVCCEDDGDLMDQLQVQKSKSGRKKTLKTPKFEDVFRKLLGMDGGGSGQRKTGNGFDFSSISKMLGNFVKSISSQGQTRGENNFEQGGYGYGQDGMNAYGQNGMNGMDNYNNYGQDGMGGYGQNGMNNMNNMGNGMGMYGQNGYGNNNRYFGYGNNGYGMNNMDY